MQRQAIFPPGRPGPTAPYSPGIRLGNLLFTAGAVGQDVNGKVPSEIGAQTRLVFENLKAVLAAAGTDLTHVLKVTVFLTDMSEFAAMNDVYRSQFSGDLPARSTVGVSALARPEFRVEIEMIAQIP